MRTLTRAVMMVDITWAHENRCRWSVVCAAAMFMLAVSGCGDANGGGASTTTTAARSMSSASASSSPTSTRSVLRPPSGSENQPELLEQGASWSFGLLQRHLQDEAKVSVAIEPLGAGSVTVLGDNPEMQGMSTTKVLILTALLRDRGGVARLTDAQRALAQAAITASDNQAILELFSILEQDRGGLLGASAYATRLLRDAGDVHTSVATAPPPAGYTTTFGQTRWSPTAEVTFFRFLALGCLLPKPDTDYVLGLMRRIEPSESWGLGSAGFSSVAFKGGWGPLADGDYGVRQTGIVGRGSRAAVVALAADPATSFATGTLALSEVAHWVKGHLLLSSRPTISCAEARSA